LKKKLITISAKRATEVIFVSNHSRKHITPIIDIPWKHTKVIYHGIDLNKFNRKNEKNSKYMELQWGEQKKPYILCVSTVTRHKNFETLIQAYSFLPENIRYNYDLVIAGRIADADYFKNLKKLSNKLKINNQVKFIGEFPYSKVQNLYFSASVFVLPSLLETFGHILVEAMASELPVIAARTTCIPEIVGEGGLFFDPYDSKQLASMIEFVLNTKSIRESLKRKNRIRAKKFNWDVSAKKLIDLMRNVGKM